MAVDPEPAERQDPREDDLSGVSDEALDRVADARLWSAMGRRFGVFVFGWVRSVGPGQEASGFGWQGSWFGAYGLAKFLPTFLESKRHTIGKRNPLA